MWCWVGTGFIRGFKVCKYLDIRVEIDVCVCVHAHAHMCVVCVSGICFLALLAKKTKKQEKPRSNEQIVPRSRFLNTILHKEETMKKCLNPEIWLKNNKIILGYPDVSENKEVLK